MNNTEYSNIPKLNKKELYSLVVNALTEGDSFIIFISNSWMRRTCWVPQPYIGGYVTLKKAKRGYFSLETYRQYKIGMYEIHKYKGTISVSDKRTDNI